jgi:hypothetical protein
MSEALTVHTHFQDVAELAAGLADRVEDGRVILYGPNNYETGATIPFAILLADGSPLIEGHGVVTAAVDGGEDRDPAFRYDVVLTELEMDPRSEIMFARVLMGGEDGSRQTALPAEEAPEEAFEQVDVSADLSEDLGGFQDESTAVADLSSHAAAMMPGAGAPEPEPAPEEAVHDAGAADDGSAADDDDVPVSTEVEPEAFSVTTGEFVDPEPSATSAADDDSAVGVDDSGDDDDRYGASDPYASDEAEPGAGGGGSALVDGAMAPPEAPAPPAGFTVARLAEVGLSRPVHAATWWPEPSARPEPEPSTGAFEYTGALPIPSEPPRPDLDPSQRVAPAPHPVAEGAADARVADEQPAAAPAASATVDEHAATYAADDIQDVQDVQDVDDPQDVDDAQDAQADEAREYDDNSDVGDDAVSVEDDLDVDLD